jgi:transposase
VYLFGAVNPQTGDSVALVLPEVDTAMMNLHLKAISQHVGPTRQVVLVLDNAGWHTAGKLLVPDNITLLPLPSRTPEENPIERLWLWIKDHYFSNRTYRDYDTLLDEVCRMWRRLEPTRIQSVCRCQWLQHPN